MKNGKFLFLLLLGLFYACSIKYVSSKKVNEVMETCGYGATPDSMYKYAKSELDIYKLKPGNTVADIGIGYSWMEGLLLVYYDSLKLYGNDISRFAIKWSDTITKRYIQLRNMPNTNVYTVVKGAKTKTNLPENTFDKIIVRETFHHFKKPHDMLLDIKTKLKQDGRLYIYEPDLVKTSFSKQCGSLNYSAEDLRKFFTSAGFTIVEEHILTDSPGAVPSWWLGSTFKAVPVRVYVLSKKF